MSDFHRQAQAFAASDSSLGTQAEGAIDQGLRSYMSRVYGLMSAAMLITGGVAYFVGNTPALVNAIYGTPLQWVVMLAPLALVFLLVARVHKMATSTAQAVFWVYAALVGASISFIFLVYTDISIVRTFFITAVAFLGLSLYGYTTKRNLTAMGSFLIMGLIGILVAMVVNIFLASEALSFAVSVLGVLIFAGLTAYDTQRIKNTYLQIRHSGGAAAGEIQGKFAIMGALTLYLDFLNLFLFLLQFLGAARE